MLGLSKIKTLNKKFLFIFRSKLHLKRKIGEKFIKELSHKINQKTLPIRERLSKLNKVCDEKGVYKSVKREAATVLLNGFVLWISISGLGYLTGYWKLANPLLIPCYGIIPWFTILFVKELKDVKT